MSKKSTPARSGQDTDMLLACYRGMLRIRKVEQRLSKLFADKEIPGFIHLSIGQESVPVAISRHLRDTDTIAATHRGHGQALAKGIDLTGFVAEMMGREHGICRGRGGSMHIADAKLGMLGANGIVGGGISLATGSALAHKLAGNGDLAVCYFGDGALAEGIFHECLNLAALWSLPVLFACENNGWGEFSRTDRQFCGSLERLAGAFGVPYRYADGLDVIEVTDVAGTLIAQMREDRRPAVLECRVERFHGHYEGDPQKYRDPAEMALLAERDPLARARQALTAAGVDTARFEALEAEIEAEIDAAVAEARAAPIPDFAAASADVYAQA
ncbi:MAG: thiamine pyrophosphate-dependent dehydrogenase E1 component subunit alpha [Gammaproteobacteria bacterium]|nr:thiamine pyrophosphate-dependent dehydrogenase E1 component subunit alpha [Gammaproteobacteria bacterium]